MRIEFSMGDLVKIIEVPKDVDMAGAMIQCNGWVQGATLQFEAEGISRQEEEIFNNGTTRVVALYYRAPKLAEVMQDFVGFEGMACVEVQEGDCQIRILI